MRMAKMTTALLTLTMTLVVSASASATTLEFHGDTNAGFLTLSGTQEFVLGSDLLRCNSSSFGYEVTTTATRKMLLVPSYSECELERLGTWSSVTMINENCEWELQTNLLHEIRKGEYNEGKVSLVKGPGSAACSLRFEGGGCGDAFEAQGPDTEYKWTDLNTIFHFYESELNFAVSGLTYKHTGTSCGTGSGGKYIGKVDPSEVIIS